MYLEIIKLNITMHVMPTNTEYTEIYRNMIIQSKRDEKLANNYLCPIFLVNVFIIFIKQAYAFNRGVNAAPAV